LIAQNWKRITKRIAKSALSASKPILSTKGGRAIELTTHSELYEKRLQLLGMSRYVVLSDVSQFFPSLYTHSIAWALHGKGTAKLNRSDKRLLGNRLDSSIQHCQHRQTIGVPIGPDTSHILAEIVGSAIDEQLSDNIGHQPRGYRHVDDFALFVDSLSEAETALSALESAASTFELKLNPLKTRIVPVEELLDDSWSHVLQTFEFSPIAKVQRKELHHFFETAQQLFLSQRDEAAIRYALGRLSAVIVKKQNWDILQGHLLRCAVAFPSSLQEVSLLFFTYELLGYKPDHDRLEKAINLIAAEHMPLQHHSELAWALWLSLHFKLKVSCPLNRADTLKSGATTLLLLLELKRRKHLSAKLDSRWLKQFNRPGLLFDEEWLFTYEAGRRGWLPAIGGKNVCQMDTLFAALHDNNVSFFDPALLPEPLFRPKESSFEHGQLESDNDVGPDFDYAERTKGYQGPEVHKETEEDAESGEDTSAIFANDESGDF
jgi:hypothetical protein